MTEYCAVIGPALYRVVQQAFQISCGTRCGHARLCQPRLSTASQGSCHLHGPGHLPLFVSNEKGEKWSNQCQPRFFYSQPASATAICMAPRAETRTLPPVLPFLLAQNLSSKQIAPSDNCKLAAKLHDEYTYQ